MLVCVAERSGLDIRNVTMDVLPANNGGADPLNLF